MGGRRLMAAIITAVVICLAVIPASPVAAVWPPEVRVYVDGVDLGPQMDVKPIIENGRTLVPLRAITEALGFHVEWTGLGATLIRSNTQSNVVINLWPNELGAYARGRNVTLDVAPRIVGDRMLVPLRFISEETGADVTWDQDEYIVDIRSKPLPPQRVDLSNLEHSPLGLTEEQVDELWGKPRWTGTWRNREGRLWQYEADPGSFLGLLDDGFFLRLTFLDGRLQMMSGTSYDWGYGNVNAKMTIEEVWEKTPLSKQIDVEANGVRVKADCSNMDWMRRHGMKVTEKGEILLLSLEGVSRKMAHFDLINPAYLAKVQDPSELLYGCKPEITVTGVAP